MYTDQKENESLVTRKERLNMPFVEYGDKVKVRVVDFDKVIAAIIADRDKKGLSMIIELKAIKIDKHKELADTISWSKDHTTAIYYGIPFGFHIDGNVKWRKILLQEFNSFNLRNPDEAKQWIVIRMHPHIKGSPFQAADPIFEIFDADVEASKTSNRAMLVSNAINKAYKMKKNEILNFHRYLNLPSPFEITPSRIKSDIVTFAMENPEEFMARYDAENRKIYEVFSSAKALGIISYDLEKGFIYKGTFLGFTDFEVIRFLEEDTITLNGLHTRVKELDTEQEKFANSKEVTEV